MSNVAEVTPRWRLALENRDDELYRAAWLIFSPDVKIEAAASQLKDEQETVLPFIQIIMDDHVLGELGAPGNGKAPERAVTLLGEWERTDKFDDMIAALEKSYAGDFVYEAVINVMVKLGSAIVDKLVAWVDEKPQYRVEVSEILSRIDDDEETKKRGFEKILSWITPEGNEDEMRDFVVLLFEMDVEKAIEELDSRQKTMNFDEEFAGYLKDAVKNERKAQRQEKQATKKSAKKKKKKK